MSWRFASTPKWLVRHVLVVALVAVMVWAGFWQLRRLDDRRAYVDLVEQRQEAPAADLSELLPAGVSQAAVDDVLYRPVTVSGTYLDDETVVVPNRTLNGAPGGWVLTPLQPEEGPAVVVNRGFIGFDDRGRITATPAPEGRVRVAGLVFPSQERGRVIRSDGDDAGPAEISSADLDVYADLAGADILPAYVQAGSSDPPEPSAAAGEPQLVPLGAPQPDEGPHLGYAAQWFIFSTIAVGGYLLLLRRVAIDRAKEEAAAAAASDLDRELEELLRSES